MKNLFSRFLLPAAMLTVLPASAEILKSWEDSSDSKAYASLYVKGGYSAVLDGKSSDKAPDGSAVTIVKIGKSALGDKKPYNIQMNFNSGAMLEAGRKYQVSFYAKLSKPGTLSGTIGIAYAPYSTVAGNSFKLSGEWKKCVIAGTARKSLAGPLSAPRLVLGNLPGDSVLELGRITFECLTPDLGYALGNEWQVTGNGKTLTMTGNNLDFQNAGFPLNGTVTLKQTLTVKQAGVMQIGAGADWYFDFKVNGQSVCSTMKSGNLAQEFAPENHVFNLPLKAGKNQLAVTVKSGSRGFRFVYGKVAKINGDPRLAQLFKPVAGKEFRPVDAQKFLVVQKGSALDFSSFNPYPLPAGSLGRLVIGKNGQAEFEKRPGKPVRLLAFNWMPAGMMWRGDIHHWDHAKIDLFADAVQRRGYTAIRIHIPETFLIGWDNWLKNRYKKVDGNHLAQTPEEIGKLIDKGNFDRYDYFVAAFKKRGIYVFIDLAGRPMITHTGNTPHEESFKAYLFYDARFRNHWKAYASFLMNRVNPYTNTAYKDEPSIACINFINEQDLRFASGLKFLTVPFRNWLRKKYGSDEALSKSWGGSYRIDAVPDITEGDLTCGGNRTADTGKFLIESMQQMSRFFETTLRELGYKGLTTHWDMIMRTLEIPARAMLPVISQHTYFAHPGKVPADNCPIKKSIRPNSFVGNHGGNTTTRQDSGLDANYFRAAAAARFLDRPYMVTEYSHCGPNKFRHERGLYFSGYASLQGWELIAAHGNTVGLHLDPFLSFDSYKDPVSITNEQLAALIYQRGDVGTAPHAVELELQRDRMFPKNFLGAISDDYARIALVTRLGITYREGEPMLPVGKPVSDLKLVPDKFNYLSVSQWYVSASTEKSGLLAGLFRQLREKNILTAANPTDPAKGVYQSETKELLLDLPHQRFSVVTPRLEGVVLKKSEEVKLNLFHIRSLSKPAAVTIAAIDGKKPLAKADRLLLFLQTNAFNTGEIFNNRSLSLCYESGNYPALIETVKLDAEFNNGRTAVPEVYALHFNGERAQRLPVSVKNGKLQLKIDTANFKYGASVLEIVYPRQ